MLLYPKMPTKKVTCNKDKEVLVRVYVEKPSRMKRSSSSSVQQHHHHHQLHYHIHQKITQEVVHGPECNNKGYDRRAGLLRYSHQLRESARGDSSTPLFSKFANNNLQPAPIQMATSKKKPKYAERPGCFGNWKLLIPSFLRSWSNALKKKKKKKHVDGVFSGNGLSILQVGRRSFISNVFSTTRKRA